MSIMPEAGQPRLNAHLAGVALTSPDPRKLSEFYTGAMGYEGRWSAETWTGLLDGRWLSIGQGPASTLDHAVFGLADEGQLADLRARLAAASIVYEEAGPTALHGRSLRCADPDGNALLFAVADPHSAEPESTAPSARLQHIVFASDQAGKMLRFYCDVIGFAPSDYVMDESGDLTSAFLRCSQEHHSLAIFRAPRRRLDHLCYDVESWTDIRDWADRFAERRILLRWGPGRHGPGNNLFFFINDPDGNWLEFSAELEVVEGARPIKLWAHEERTLNSWGAAYMRS